MAPNIREKIKDRETKKFLKLSKQELIEQITNVLKPKSDVNELESIENLLKSKFTEETETELTDPEPTIEVGTVGIFRSFGGVKSLGVVLDPTALQLYEPCRYGFSCNDGTESLSD